MSKIKNKLKSKFDKKQNYNEILSKIERKSNIEKNLLLKYSLVPICLIFVVVGYMIFNTDNITKPNDYYEALSTSNADKININNIDGAAQTSIAVKMNAEARAQEKFEEFPFLDELRIPNGLSLTSRYLLYTKKTCSSKEECQNLPYDVLHDYVTFYEKKVNDIVEKQITISFSKGFQPLRDYIIENSNTKASFINTTPLTISKYEKMYIVTFRYNSLNFDIETNGISEYELIQLLESIIID